MGFGFRYGFGFGYSAVSEVASFLFRAANNASNPQVLTALTGTDLDIVSTSSKIVPDDTGTLVTIPAGDPSVPHATISWDTADGAVLGSELVTDSDFSLGTGWTKSAFVNFVGGEAVFTEGTSANALYRASNETLSIGDRISITAVCTEYSGTNTVRATSFGSSDTGVTITGVGTFTYTQSIISTNQNLGFFAVIGAGNTVKITSFSVKEITPAYLTPAGATSEEIDGLTALTLAGSDNPMLAVLCEPAASNYLATPATPATQTTGSLGVGSYILWMEGTGSVDLTAGTATISTTGTATDGSPVLFNVTVAGTVTCTVTGTPTRFNLTGGSAKTTFISSVATRNPTYETLLGAELGNTIKFRFSSREALGRVQYLLGDETSGAGCYLNTSGKVVFRGVDYETEKITNAADRTFSSDTGFWNITGTVAITSGVARFNGGGGVFRRTSFLTIGAWYKAVFTLSGFVADGGELYLTDGIINISGIMQADGVYSFTFKATGSTFGLYSTANPPTVDVDDISLKAQNELTSTSTYTANTPIDVTITQSAVDGTSLAIDDTVEDTDAAMTTPVTWGTTVQVGADGSGTQVLNGGISILRSE